MAAYVFLELVDEEFEECVVEIFTAQQRIAIGGLDLEDALLNLQDRHVKGAAAQIVYGNTKMEP